jgi:hypothetical protein
MIIDVHAQNMAEEILSIYLNLLRKNRSSLEFFNRVRQFNTTLYFIAYWRLVVHFYLTQIFPLTLCRQAGIARNVRTRT